MLPVGLAISILIEQPRVHQGQLGWRCDSKPSWMVLTCSSARFGSCAAFGTKVRAAALGLELGIRKLLI